MKEIPILFSTPMVQAILAGRKSITRRLQGLEIINEKPDNYAYKGIHPDNPSVHIFARLFLGIWVETIYIKCPYGQPGDVLWVRETWAPLGDYPRCNYTFMYKADVSEFYSKWKPSIHMPKEAARIWLKVVNVRVERLHEITEQDAIAEGVEKCIADKERFGARAVGMRLFRNYERKDNSLRDYPCNGFEEAKISFETLWQSINGRESWDANPWVWVVEFEVLSTTGRPCSI